MTRLPDHEPEHESTATRARHHTEAAAHAALLRARRPGSSTRTTDSEPTTQEDHG